MTNKLTNRKVLAIAIAVFQEEMLDEDVAFRRFEGQDYPIEDIVAKLEAMAATLDNKADTTKRKPTAKQIENNSLRERIMDFLTANPNLMVTCTDMTKKIPALEGMNNQKVSALMKPLVDSGKVTKVTEKGKSVFQLAKLTEEMEDGNEG